jgi:hypothetical protein
MSCVVIAKKLNFQELIKASNKVHHVASVLEGGKMRSNDNCRWKEGEGKVVGPHLPLCLT